MDVQAVTADVERGSMSRPDTDPAFVRRLAGHCRRMLDAIKRHHEQTADDRCWIDDFDLYRAAGLPCHDATVGDRFEMLKNCARFIENRCEGGTWRSYAELSEDLARVTAERDRLEKALALEQQAGAALRAQLAAARAELAPLADRQDAFAGPQYTHLTDAHRDMFRHAARMLREAARRYLAAELLAPAPEPEGAR